MEKFPKILKDLMDNNNTSTKELADYLEVNIRNVQRYLKGQQTPPSEKLVLIADYFNVSIDYLVGRTDNPEINR